MRAREAKTKAKAEKAAAKAAKGLRNRKK